MLAITGFALNLSGLFLGHFDDDMIGIASAFGAMGFYRTTSGKGSDLHNISPLFETSQVIAD
jgi:hypothetical protein